MIRISKFFSLTSIASIALLGAACGGDDDGGDNGDNGGTDISFVDSGPGGGTPDGAPVMNCPIDSNLGTIESIQNAVAGGDTQDPQPETGPEGAMSYFVVGGIGNDDFFELDLWDGYGAFTEGDKRAAPGTYTIEGAETTALNCGVCGFLFGNVTQGGGGVMVEKTYIATQGTITIDAVSAAAMSGSGAGLVFTEINENSEDGSALPGGCTVSISSITFSGNAPPPM